MCSTWRTRQVLKQCDCWHKRATEKTSENFDFFLSLSLDRYRQYVMCVTVQCKVFNQDQGNLQHRRQIISPVACWIVCRWRFNLYQTILIQLKWNHQITAWLIYLIHILNKLPCCLRSNRLEKNFNHAAGVLTNNIRNNSAFSYRLRNSIAFSRWASNWTI